MGFEVRGVWYGMLHVVGDEGMDCRRVLRISVDAELEADLFDRGSGAFQVRFGLGTRDKADGDFFVGSRITQVSKLASG
jgi:hypothetical protein